MNVIISTFGKSVLACAAGLGAVMLVGALSKDDADARAAAKQSAQEKLERMNKCAEEVYQKYGIAH